MLEPNQTLYVKNIDWKIKKGLLRRALYSLFTRHGKVLEVITLRKDGLRGQAWVIMDSVNSATAALQAENGFTFFEKDLVVEYAKEKSDRIAKRDGTYVPKSKRKKKQKEEELEKDEGAETAGDGGEEAEGETADNAAGAAAETAEETDTTPPSKYLLAEKLPKECNEMMLGMLFRQYNGYKETRMPRPGIAFIEFESESYATLAKQGLNGFQLTTNDKLVLKYGKS